MKTFTRLATIKGERIMNTHHTKTLGSALFAAGLLAGLSSRAEAQCLSNMDINGDTSNTLSTTGGMSTPCTTGRTGVSNMAINLDGVDDRVYLAAGGAHDDIFSDDAGGTVAVWYQGRGGTVVPRQLLSEVDGFEIRF